MARATNNISKPPPEIIDEMKAECKPKSESKSVCLSSVKVGCELQEIIQLERYSSIKAKIIHLELKVDELPVQETEDAGNAWMREIQRSIVGSHKFLRRCSIHWVCCLIKQVYFVVGVD